MSVINGQMVSCYANYLLARVDQDDEAPVLAVPGLVTMDGTTGTFSLIDSDGTVLEVTVRPVAVKDADPEAWAYL